MNKKLFNEKVKKQLWFLNSKEKKQLNERLIQISGNENVDYNKPIKFSNQYLKRYMFKEKSVTSFNIFLILIGIIVVYALLLGLITSLTAVHYFIVPKVQLSSMLVLLIIILAIMIMIVSLFVIKQVTALFTKNLLEYKFNKK